MKVYIGIIQSGEYEDAQEIIYGVYSNKKVAEKQIKERVDTLIKANEYDDFDGWVETYKLIESED